MVSQVLAELFCRVEGLVAAVDTLPPFAMRLQLVLEPLMSAFVCSIWDLALVEGADLSP